MMTYKNRHFGYYATSKFVSVRKYGQEPLTDIREEITKLHKKKWSAGKIAEALGMTENAVYGYAQRMGLTFVKKRK